MPQQEQQLNASASNQEFFLQDLSAVDASLNESYAKPMLQNPIGLNQSYVANLSNNDVSKSKLDASISRYPYIELGQKQREAQQEYYELNPNQTYQNDNLKVRPIALSKGALLDVTDDTKDLSQMSLNHLKGNIYSQNNSYYLNNSTLQDPNRTRKHDSIMAKAADLSQKMDQHLKGKSHNNSINIVDNFVPIENNNSEIRHTANFGKNVAMSFSSQQPADLLSYVNSGADLKPTTTSESSSTFNNPVFTQSERRSTQGIIPKESRGMTKGAAKEIEVILEGLETLELSKISSLSENFLEDEEENHAKDKNTQSKPQPQPQTAHRDSSPAKPTMSFTENLAQKILADVKKNLDHRPPAVKLESQYSSNTRAESQYNTHNNTKSDPQDFTLNNNNNKNFFSAQLASPTNNSNILSNYQTNFTSTVAAPKVQISDPTLLNQEDLSKKLTQIQTASPTKNSEQSTYRNLSIHSGHKFTAQFDSYRGAKTTTNKESIASDLLMMSSKDSMVHNEAFTLSNKKYLETAQNSNFKTPQRAAIVEASQMMERMQSLYKEFKDKNAELNDYVQELTQSPARSSIEPTYRTSNATIPKNSAGNSLMKFNEDIDNRQVRQTTHGFLEKKARFSSYSKSPFDMRYSVRDPNTFDALPNEAAAMKTESNYQEFIKEDLLKDLDSPNHSKVMMMQSKLKTFSNPVFKKDSISSRDSQTPVPERPSRQSKRDYHQESMNLINKIFDTPASTKPIKTEERSTTPHEKKVLNQSQGPLEARSQNITTAPSIVVVVENKSSIFDKQKPERPKVNHRTRRNLSSIFEDEVNISVGGDEEINIQLPVINYRSTKDLFNHTIFGFNVKQEKFIEGRDERKVRTDNMEIICINCQEFIKISKVDKHSQTCDKSPQQPDEDQNRSIHYNISQLNVKLFGIKDRIKHKSSSLGSKGPSVVESLNQIAKLVDKIIDENDSADSLIALIRQVEVNLDHLSNNNLVDQDLGLLIYINRILVLAQEKYNELEDSEEDLTTLEDQIRAYQRETIRQKAELEVWQHQAQVMEQIKQSDDKNMKYVKRHYKKDNEVLSQIQSDIEVSEKESSHGGTTETSGSGAISQGNFVAFKTPKENAQSENNKVKFYSLAVNIKLTLPSTHKGKDVLISDLYDVCLAEKVPEKEWDTFIRSKLMS